MISSIRPLHTRQLLVKFIIVHCTLNWSLTACCLIRPGEKEKRLMTVWLPKTNVGGVVAASLQKTPCHIYPSNQRNGWYIVWWRHGKIWTWLMDIWTVGLFFGPFFGTSLRKRLMTSFLYQWWRGARVVIITIFLGRVRNVALGEGGLKWGWVWLAKMLYTIYFQG